MALLSKDVNGVGSLLLYCLAVMANQMMGITFSSMTGRVTTFFDLSHGAAFINMCYILFLGMYLPTTVPAAIIIERCGVRFSVIVLAVLTTTGAVFRCLLLVPGCAGWLKHVILLASAAVMGGGQAFGTNMPAKVAHIFFDEKYWGTCTALGCFSVPVGVVLGCVVPSFFSSVGSIVVFDTFFCGAVLILCVYFLREPSSRGLPTETEPLFGKKNLDIFQSYKKLVCNLTFLRFLILTSVALATGQAFTGTIEEVLTAYGYTDKQASIVVTCLNATTIVYGIFSGVLLDITNAPFFLLFTSVVLICISMFAIAITVSSSSFYAIVMGSVLLGIGTAPVWPVSLEVACKSFSKEVGGEAIVTSLFLIGVQSTCITTVFVQTIFIEWSPITLMWLLFGLDVCGCIPPLCCMNKEVFNEPEVKSQV